MHPPVLTSQLGSPSAPARYTLDPAIPASLKLSVPLAGAGRWRLLVRSLGTGGTQDIPSVGWQESPLYTPAAGATPDATRYGASTALGALAHGALLEAQPPTGVPDCAASGLLTFGAPAAAVNVAIELGAV